MTHVRWSNRCISGFAPFDLSSTAAASLTAAYTWHVPVLFASARRDVIDANRCLASPLRVCPKCLLNGPDRPIHRILSFCQYVARQTISE